MGVEGAVIGLAAASAATGIAGAATSAAGGGDSGAGRYKLTPEYEIGFLDQLEGNLTNIDLDIQKTSDIEKTLVDKLHTQELYMQNLLPKEEMLKKMVELDTRMAQKYGESVLNQTGGAGYLGKAAKQEYEKLLKGGTGVTEDPTVERQIREGRESLVAQLRRSLGPGAELTSAGITALAEFDKRATETRFDVSQGLQTAETQRSATRMGMLGAGLEGELAMMGTMQGQRQGIYNLATQTAGNIAGLAGAQAEAARQAMAIRQQLRGESLDTYNTLGSYDISKSTQRALQAGLIGPGSYGQQTGVPRKDLRGYRDYAERRESAGYWGGRGVPGPASPGQYPYWKKHGSLA